ncbi:ESPR-type extended signal peptide-containing protein, partial [Halomonas piscis]|uniref:ESPR-type extended signal peptide-containing protein n=1 Tax=Halomonas piscis TaxID=3031727 RepID=UPI0028A0F9C2
MNRIFRKVWNHSLGRLVVASEAARSRGKAGVSKKVMGTLAGGVIALPLSTLAVGALTLEDGALLENTDGNLDISEEPASGNDPKKITLDLAQAIEVANKITVDGSNDVRLDNSGLALAGGPSVKSGGIDAGGEKITNVSAGTSDSDAVNVGQLNAVKSTANQGWNVTDGTSSSNIGPDGKVTFTGDSNVTVTESGSDDDGQISVALNDDLTAASLTAGDTTVDNNGLSIDGGPSITSGGIDAGGSKITNVADGTSAGDAINKGQLDAVSSTANAGFKLQANGSDESTVKPDDTVNLKNSDGNIDVSKSSSGNDVTFDLADTVSVDKVEAGASTLDTDGLSITGGPTFTSSGIDAGGQKITGVSDGGVSAGSQDAITGGQLFDLEEELFTDGDGIKYFHANSTKDDSQANGGDSVAIGPESVAEGDSSFAAGLGAATSSAADNGIALGNQASAEAGNSLAMGNQANAVLASGTAIGNQAQARADSSIAIGKQTLAQGDNATSIGATGDPITSLDLADDDTNLTSINGIPVTATGYPLNEDGTYNPTDSAEITSIAGVAVDEAGVNQFISALMSGANFASGKNSLSLGVGTIATGDSGVAIGDRTSAADDAVGIGHGTTAAGSAVGIGPGATASGANSFAGGKNAKVVGKGSNAVAIGNNSQAGHGGKDHPNTSQTLDPSGKSAVAVGDGAQAQMNHDVAMGEGAGSGSFGLPSADISNVYIGRNAGAGVFAGGRNVAIGADAGKDRADDSDENVAIGNKAGLERGGNYNIALGKQAGGSNAKDATGSLTTDDTISIGRKANASDSGALALGASAVASGENSLALGQGTSTNNSGSIALGSGSVADKAVNAPSAGAYLTGETASSILSIGSENTGTTRRVVNVAGGVKDTDAVNVGQLSQLGDEVQGVFGDDVTVDADGSLSFSRDGETTLSSYLNENGAPGGGNPGSPGANVVKYDGSTQDDITLADTQIHKVADGTSPKDAVNVSQLEEAGTHFVSVNTPKDDTNYDNDGASGDDAIAIGPTDGASGDSSLVIGRNAKAEGQYGLALGEGADSKGESATAIGLNAYADADRSIAIGEDSRVENQAGKADANSGIGVGYKARVTREHGTAIGESALSESAQGQAYGYQAHVHQESENSNAIGNIAVVNENADGANAFGDHATVEESAHNSTAIGSRANTNATNAYALGTQAQSSGNSAYAQGNEARASAINAFALGSKKDSNRTEASAKHAYAVGSGAQSEASRAYAIGADARASQATAVSGKDAFAIGTEALVNEDSAYALGNKASSIAESGYAVGTQAESTAESGYAMGTQASSEKADSFAIGSNANTDGLNAYALGNTAKASGDNAFAAGTDSVSGGENAIAFGKNAATDTTGKNAIAIGTGSTASSENGVALGTNATVSGKDSLSLGTGSLVTGDSSGAFGDPNTVNATGAYAFGNDNTIDTGANNSFVLGSNVTLNQAYQANSVVLGNNSDTHEVHTGTKATESTLNDETRVYTGPASKGNGFVSVGSEGGERQIHNVAAGEVSETSTDAINGSQLFATNQAVQQPITFEGDNGAGNAVERTLNTTLNIQGGASGNLTDDNIGVEGDGTDTLELKLAENVDLGTNGSVTTGNSELDNGGLSVDDGTNSTDYGADEIAMNDGAGATTRVSPGKVEVAGSGNTVTLDGDAGTIDGLTNKTFDAGNITSGQAATEDQLSQVNSDLTTSGLDFKGNSNPNGAVHRDLGETLNIEGGAATAGAYSDDNVKTVADNGSVSIQLAENPEFTSVTTGNSTLDNDGMTIAGGPSVTTGGIDADGKKITNVADGEVSSTSSDAVNGSQLNATNNVVAKTGNSAADVIGGNASYDDATGDLTTTDIGGTGQDTVHDAIAVAGTGWELEAAGTNGTETINPGDTATFDAGTNLDVERNGSTITYATHSEVEFDKVTADDGSGNVTEVTATGTSVTDGTDRTDYGAGGMEIAGGPSVTTGGIDAGDNKITNVEAGTDDTDAVNVSQLESQDSDLTTKGLDFAGNEGGDVHRDLGETLSITGGANATGGYSSDNLKTVTDPTSGAIELQLAESPKFGDVTINEDDSGRISGVADGENADDAVNLGQLEDVDATANEGWSLTAQEANESNVGPGDSVDLSNTDDNIEIAKADTDNDVTFDLADDLTADSLKTGDTTVDGSGVTIAGGPSITDSGIDAGDQTITNVAPGVDGTDAVNVNQLDDVSDAANAGWTVADADGNSHNIGPNGKVTFEGDSNIGVTESGSDDDAKIQVALNDDIAVDSVTTGDSVLDTNGLTVTDGTTTTTVGADNVTSGNVVVDGSQDVVSGLSNTTYDPNVDYSASDQAASEAQLGGLGDSLTSDGMNFAGDSGTDVHRDLGETVNIQGGETDGSQFTDGNIGVVADGSDTLNLKLAQNVDLGG